MRPSGDMMIRIAGSDRTGRSERTDTMKSLVSPGLLLAAWLLLLSPPAAADDSSSVALPAGIEVRLRFEDAVSSATAIQGQRFKLTVDEDLLRQGRIVIPRGTSAVGTVLDVERSGQMGAGGMLSIKVDYLQFGAQRLRLHWTLNSADRSQESKARWVSGIFVPMGLTIKGKEVEVAAGTRISATTKDKVDIVIVAPEASAVTTPSPAPD